MVKGPSYLENPEPGTYYKPVNWLEPKNTDKTLAKYKSATHKEVAVIPQ